MRIIKAHAIKEAVRQLAIDTNYHLSKDVFEKLVDCEKNEVSNIGKGLLSDLIENAKMADKGVVPICQDTGMAIVFLEIGQDVHIEGDYISHAINQGVREGYEQGFLRKSVVANPIERKNTMDNTPAIIHMDIVPGDKVVIQFSPKGFGSENMSRIKMLNPSDGVEGVIDFVLETVELAGSNPCPPIVVGVGIGGSFEKCALMAKKALLRDVNTKNPDENMKELEVLLLDRINNLGIGPEGLGGISTALGVNIEWFATHIAGLPVAVNISCHATRHGKIEI